MFGLLPIDKTTGITSRRAIDSIKKLVRPAKVGHCGTLDPLASGVLLVCLGPATRLTKYIHQLPKTYLATFQLGVRSASDDTESELIPVPNSNSIDSCQLKQTISEFAGNIMQAPPTFSAIKVSGKRAYELSRKGQSIDMASRPITIHEIELIRFDSPIFELKVCCSSGTYIRALGRDIGLRLGSAAVMTKLIRLAIGKFTLERCADVQVLNRESLAKIIINPVELFQLESLIVFDGHQIEQLKRGYVFTDLNQTGESFKERIAIDSKGRMLAVLVPRGNALIPRINFAHFHHPSKT